MGCCSRGFVSQRHSLDVLSTIINQDEILVRAIKGASSSITEIYMDKFEWGSKGVASRLVWLAMLICQNARFTVANWLNFQMWMHLGNSLGLISAGVAKPSMHVVSTY